MEALKSKKNVGEERSIIKTSLLENNEESSDDFKTMDFQNQANNVESKDSNDRNLYCQQLVGSTGEEFPPRSIREAFLVLLVPKDYRESSWTKNKASLKGNFYIRESCTSKDRGLWCIL